jgi:thiamine-phosphate pyrophosphorylase
VSIPRIIDANANRAREALRVMEEAARFIIDDAALTRSLKELRHALRASLEAFGGVELHRDVTGDVGTGLSTPAELERTSAHDVVTAAGRRLGEALRVLEEYGKTIDPGIAGELERLRYAAYEHERRLTLALGSGRGGQWAICVLLSEAQCGARPWAEVAKDVADARPDCIQVREKDLDDRTLLERVRVVMEAAQPGTAVVVNDRPDVALLAGAHGVHVGPDDLPCRDVRRLVGRDLLIGVSTARIEDARAALADGADYCGVGPMFPSTTKDKPVTAGPRYLEEYLAWGRLPHVAIGGITPENVGTLAALGCRGVAVSAAVCAAADPGAAIDALRDALATAAATTGPTART